MGRKLNYSCDIQLEQSALGLNAGEWKVLLGPGAFEGESADVPESVTSATPISGIVQMPSASQGFASIEGTWGSPSVDDELMRSGVNGYNLEVTVTVENDGSLSFHLKDVDS